MAARPWLNAVRLGLAALLLSACSHPDATPADRELPLQVGLDLWAGYYPALLAEQLGYFRDAQVAVELSIPEDTDQLLVDFAAGSLDGIGVASGDTINVVEANPDSRIILFSDLSNGADVVLGLPPVNVPEDLQGRVVGTNLGGFGELLVRQMLDQHGVRPSAVKVVNVDASRAVDRLLSGEVAAVHTWEPYASRARAQGAKVLYSSRDADGLILDGFIFSGETLRAHPTAVRRFVSAWFRAVEHWQAHPEEDNALLVKRLAAATGSVSLDGIRLFGLAEERQLFQPGSTNRSARHVLQRFVDYFLSRGTLSAVPDLDRLLDPQFLPAAK
ncbi:MAG TPA: ABC transporter substrate-binding protein [Polyangiaceae bacterium]|nr:ABC transporter substrate-binding protein [Polyangiaceae bacterium]